MPSSDDQELITVDSKRNTTLFTILLCLRPRKEETRAPKKKGKKEKKKKEKRTHSFAHMLFLTRRLRSDARHSRALSSSTDLLAAYITVLCLRKEDVL
jgi:hypothetical protein